MFMRRKNHMAPARIILIGFALLILLGAALLMLGRTTFGDPWAFWQAQAALDLLELRHFGPILENIIRLGLPQTVEELQLPPKQRRKREK